MSSRTAIDMERSMDIHVSAHSLLNKRFRKRAAKYNWPVQDMIAAVNRRYEKDEKLTNAAANAALSKVNNKRFSVLDSPRWNQVSNEDTHRYMRSEELYLSVFGVPVKPTFISPWNRVRSKLFEHKTPPLNNPKPSLVSRTIALVSGAAAKVNATLTTGYLATSTSTGVIGKPSEPDTIIVPPMTLVHRALFDAFTACSDALGHTVAWTGATTGPLTAIAVTVISIGMVPLVSDPRSQPTVITRCPGYQDWNQVIRATWLAREAHKSQISQPENVSGHVTSDLQRSREEEEKEHEFDSLNNTVNRIMDQQEVVPQESVIPSNQETPLDAMRVNAVRDALTQLDREWLEYELDTEAYYLTKPVLRDTSIPQVLAYRESLYELREAVDALDTDVTEDKLAAAEHATETTLTAWGDANDYALKIGVSDRTPVERVALRRMHGMVAQLASPSTPKMMWPTLVSSIEREMHKLTTVPVTWKAIAAQPSIDRAVLQLTGADGMGGQLPRPQGSRLGREPL
jgi:hypothetical protein